MSCALTSASGRRTVADLLALIPGFASSMLPDSLLIKPIADLMTDSRLVSNDDVFLAVKTPFGSGAEYLENALSRGAACCLVDTDLLQALAELQPEYRQQVIAVPELSGQITRLAVDYYADPAARLPVVGITGTNGKSSCVHFLAQMAGNVWDTPGGMIGTLGWGSVGQLQDTTHTTPDNISLQRLLAELADQPVSLAAIEVSSHALQQQRPAGTRFAVAAFTNLSQDHLDYHGDMAAYLQAKQRLFTDYEFGTAVIGIDDQYGARLAQTVRNILPRGAQLITTSAAGGQADVCVRLQSSAASANNGLLIEIDSPWGTAAIQTQLLGGFNTANLATCIACLGGLQVPFVQIVAAVTDLQPVPGRMQCVPGSDRQPLVIVDYAHTPDALDNALRSCREHARAELWCVFGCGGDRDQGKRPQMGRIAEQLADRLIITSDNPRDEEPENILRDIQGGLQQPQTVELEVDRQRAIFKAIRNAKLEDCILIAGRGHERTQQVGGQNLPFDDVAVAREILEQLSC